MREFRQVLNDRTEEIDAHLKFILQLEAGAVGRGTGTHTAPVDSEPINILKSGFLVHLYNVVEAVMTKVIEEVEVAAKVHPPQTWCGGLLREWAKGRVNLSRDLRVFDAEERVFGLIEEITNRRAVGNIKIRRRAGNWSEDEIERLADALTCALKIRPRVRTAACNNIFEDTLAPMKYIRHKRNSLAHGNESFIEGARHLTAVRLKELRNPVANYLTDVTASFDQYLDNKVFLIPLKP